MNSPSVVLTIRLIHILAGVFWVGGVLFITGFLMPTMRVVGPAGGPVMAQLTQVRRMPLYLMGATILTILSGASLYWRDATGLQGGWTRSGSGMVFGLGGVLGLVAAGIGMGVNSPAGRRLGALGAAAQARGGPPSGEEQAEMQRLQSRLAVGSRWVSGLLLLATAAMAVARYIP
jgi:uncharacterized membrane protein